MISGTPDTGFDYAVVRYNQNGTLDNSFGGGGKATPLSERVYPDRISGVHIQPDGKIVVAAIAYTVPDGFAIFVALPIERFDDPTGRQNRFSRINLRPKRKQL